MTTIYVLSIQEYDSPDVILYDNQDARDAHYAHARATTDASSYHVERYTLDVHSTFDPSQYE